MKDGIMSVLNEVDLEGLIAMGCPDDEYGTEASNILEYMKDKENVTIDELADEVENIYNRYFNSTGYDREALLYIAESILDLYE